ncbi:MAG: flagellar hook-basal body complex protein [Phycisphaerae bacterium]|nr:flagellar hook-basal body complex protein [Phycisphaerae bacterium]
MGITSTLYSALSGLNASQTRLDVSGNNIANVNTVAYKGSRATFQTQLSQTMSFGTPPGTASGGTNPMQFGLGVSTGAVERDFGTGSIELTGVNTDAAIQGNGFFMLQTSDGSRVYTRDGAFKIDANQRLVSADGNMLLGFAVDENFNIAQGTLSALTIPVGGLSIAQATTQAGFKGNLDASGIVAAAPATTTSQALVIAGGAVPATGNTALTAVASATAPGVALFAAGDTITVEATKGGRNLEPATFTVTNGSTAALDSGATLAELTEWLESVCGINTSTAQNPPAGISVNANGEIEIVGNLGADSVINITSMTGSGGSAVTYGSVEIDEDVQGASEFTSFQVYDSLGNPANVDITFTLIEKTSTGNTWRFYAESQDDSDLSPVVGSGTLTFDTSGTLVSTTSNSVTVNRADLGAVDPVVVSLDFSKLQGLTPLGGNSTGPLMDQQNGFPMGTLNDFAIANDGRIIGTFSNGLTRTLGQVVLATFSNPGGLIAQGDNAFVAGPNSGEPALVTPGAMGAGSLIGGALELSNVDLTREFISMITATTAFSASGRVISTSQQLLSELLSMVR